MRRRRHRRTGLPGGRAQDGRATAGSASAGRRSTAARAAPTSSSSSSSTRPGGPARRSRSSPSTPSARTIMEFGSEEQKQFFLPKILAGELHFSIGYTEPNAGTDLASLTTTAVKDGDEWVINGQKIYTSLASYADYIWLAARTDPDAPKHTGITIFLVPTTDPGFSLLEDPHDGERQHLQHLLRQRAGRRRRHRRRRQPGLAPHHQPAQLRAGVARPARDGRAGLRRGACAGRRTPSCPTAGGSSTRSGCSSTWPGCTPSSSSSSSSTGRWPPPGGANPADASATKVFGTEFYTEAYRLLMEVLGPDALPAAGLARRASLAGRLERALPGRADPHLRRRRQRGPARPHRPVRPRPAPGAAALRSDRWTSPSPTSSRRSPSWPHRILAEQLPARAPARARGRPTTWFADDVWAELGQGRPARHRPARGRRRRRLRHPRGLPDRRAGRPHRRAGAVPAAASWRRRCRSPQFGSDAQREQLLPGVIAGTAILTVALVRARRRRRARRPHHARPPPTATAGASTARSRSWSAPTGPPRILVPARTGDGRVRGVPRRPGADGVHLDARGRRERRAAVDRAPRRRPRRRRRAARRRPSRAPRSSRGPATA